MMTGKNVTKVNDPLTPVTVERLYKGLINSAGPVAAQVAQLRSLKAMDEKQYRRLKTQLPYIVTSVFVPAIRSKENFRYTSHFIIDIDHLSHSSYTVVGLKEDLQKDPRIVLLFTSPGADGLKVLFQLSDRIDDPGLYSMFYKLFAATFAQQYQLTGLVDVKTCDVSRCCFVSYDPLAVYNPQAEPVNAHEIMRQADVNDVGTFIRQVSEAEKLHDKAREEMQLPAVAKGPAAEDVLQQIKQRLNPSLAAKPQRQVEQPPELEAFVEKLPDYLQQAGVVLKKISPISYGRQVQVMAGNLMAEVNVFYGKRGYSIVKTTRTGSHPELATTLCALLQQYINETSC